MYLKCVFICHSQFGRFKRREKKTFFIANCFEFVVYFNKLFFFKNIFLFFIIPSYMKIFLRLLLLENFLHKH